MPTRRRVERIVESRALMEGAGVRVHRTIGLPELDHLDPFLLLDAFGSADPADWTAGFPEHPHRGIETVTYMLEGTVRHGDSIGNAGTIGPGDAQWMTAGRGIVHSEMPGSSTGRLQGFQLWVNLPSEQKMCPPRYQEVASGLVPTVRVPGASVRVISGSFGGARGAVDGISIDPLFIDARVDPSGTVEVPVVADHTAFVHVYEGDVEIGVTGVTRGALAVLVAGDSVSIRAGGSGARLLLVAGRPIGEPIVRWGPFVMNTEDEIRQAIEDYRMGIL